MFTLFPNFFLPYFAYNFNEKSKKQIVNVASLQGGKQNLGNFGLIL